MSDDMEREDNPSVPPLRLVVTEGKPLEGKAIQKGKKCGAARGPLLANGLTHKQEEFCLLVAQGKPLSEAYRLAYDASGMSAQAVWSEASKLMANPKVSGRVEALRKEIEAKSLHSAAQIRAHVRERLMLESMNATQDGARIRALELLGKMDEVGMFRERVETEDKRDQSVADIQKELSERLARLAKG